MSLFQCLSLCLFSCVSVEPHSTHATFSISTTQFQLWLTCCVSVLIVYPPVVTGGQCWWTLTLNCNWSELNVASIPEITTTRFDSDCCLNLLMIQTHIHVCSRISFLPNWYSWSTVCTVKSLAGQNIDLIWTVWCIESESTQTLWVCDRSNAVVCCCVVSRNTIQHWMVVQGLVQLSLITALTHRQLKYFCSSPKVTRILVTWFVRVFHQVFDLTWSWSSPQFRHKYSETAESLHQVGASTFSDTDTMSGTWALLQYTFESTQQSSGV